LNVWLLCNSKIVLVFVFCTVIRCFCVRTKKCQGKLSPLKWQYLGIKQQSLQTENHSNTAPTITLVDCNLHKMFNTCLVSACNGWMTFYYSVENLNGTIICKRACLPVLTIKELLTFWGFNNWLLPRCFNWIFQARAVWLWNATRLNTCNVKST